MQNKILYLVPTSLGDNFETIPEYVKNVCANLDCFIVENLRSARRYLRQIGYTKNFDTEVHFFEINKHHKEALEPLLDFLQTHQAIGLLSEAGNPCIADPGSIAVELCHQLNITVKPLVGPSSILMALIASGFDGQNFTFHGYLPIEDNERNKKIKSLEHTLKQTGYTQLFMETPYRNDKLIESIIKNANENTMLCIAADISLATEYIKTKPLREWKKNRPSFHKRPCLFALGN